MKRFFIYLVMGALSLSLLTACGNKDNKQEGISLYPDGWPSESQENDSPHKPITTATVSPAVQADLRTFIKVKNAINKTLAASSYSAVVKEVVESSTMGTVNTTAKDLTIQKNGQKIYVGGTTSTNLYDTLVNTNCAYYFDGTYAYEPANGTGYKIPTTATAFAADYGSATRQLLVYPQSLFVNVSQNSNHVTLYPDESTCEDLFGTTILDMVRSMVGNDLTPVTTKDGKITLSLKDGYIASYQVEFACDIATGNYTATYHYSLHTTFDTINTDVTITPPKGYQNFLLSD